MLLLIIIRFAITIQCVDLYELFPYYNMSQCHILLCYKCSKTLAQVTWRDLVYIYHPVL